MTPEPIPPEEQELARIWPERFSPPPATFPCGHPLAEENRYLVTKRGEKIWVCAECISAANKRYYQRRKLGLVGPPPPPVWRTTCKAVSADDGLRCKLLEHDARQRHRNERGEFTNVLQPGQTSARVLELASRASSGSGL